MQLPLSNGASEEIDATNNRRSGLRVVAGVCPQCGFVLYFGDETGEKRQDCALFYRRPDPCKQNDF